MRMLPPPSRVALGACAFFFFAACAALPASTKDATDGSSEGVDNAVPSASGGTNGAANSNNGVSFVRPAGTLGRASSFDGASIRWHQNPNLCITRQSATPTDKDPLTLAPCAADIKQAFYVDFGKVGINKDYVLARNSDTKEVMIRYSDNASADGTQAVYLSFSGDGTISAFGAASGFFVPKDTKGTVGTPILMDNLSLGGPTSVWDIVGVGNVGGATMPLVTSNATYCIIYGANGLATTGCDRTIAEQRWRFEGGFLVNDNGKCLTCTPSTGTCTLVNCATVSKTSPNDQRFSYGLYMTYQTPLNGAKLLLEFDPAVSKVYIGNGSDVQSGGTASYVFQIGEELIGPFL